MNSLHQVYYNSPIGLVCIEVNNDEIVYCNFEEQKSKEEHSTVFLMRVVKQFDEYFEGTRIEFDLALNLKGTDFQRKVWSTLQKIPLGTTITYKELANRVGNKNAIRAVASANAKNPISIIVPCHRVIGSDGKLRGYGGGLERKRWLIDFEHQSRLKQESEKTL